MKRKIIVILLIGTTLLLSACSTNKYDKAEKLVEKGDLLGAIEIYHEIIDKNEAKGEEDVFGYFGLANIYYDNNQVDKLTETVEVLGNRFDLDEMYYIKIFEHYKSIGDLDKIDQLFNQSYKDIKMPRHIYRDYLVLNHIPEDMEIIETKVYSLRNDKDYEIASVMGVAENGGYENTYSVLKIMIYDKRGNLLYEDSEDAMGLHFNKLKIDDLTGDGNQDIFYAYKIISESDQGNYYQLLSYKGDKIQDLMLDFEGLGISSKYLDETKIKVFSQVMRQSYIIDISSSNTSRLDLFGDTDISVKLNGINLGRSSAGEALIERIIEIGNYRSGKVHIKYGDGEFIKANMDITADHEHPVLKLKQGEEYDFKEYGKNLILGNWTQEEYGQKSGLRVTDGSIYVYIIGSEILDEYKYDILSCDEENRIVTISVANGQEVLKVDGDNLTFTATNGHVSQWERFK